MAKKKKEEPIIIPEEPIIIPIPSNMYTLDDKKTMLALWKTATLAPGQVAQVIELFRKYVNPNQPVSRGCGGCNGGLTKLYDGLRDWWSQNSSKFPV